MDSADCPTPTRELAAKPLAWLAIFWCALAQAAGAQGPLREPVDWPSRDLEIPYRWSGPTEGVASVVLYSSADSGRSWQQAGIGLPHVRAFRFNAPRDGEYWFAIRTYDTAGRSVPAGPLGPEMRVRVDTAGPAIGRMDARLEGQTLRVTLDATDTTALTAEGVSLFARAEGRPGWLPIPVTRAEPSPNGRAIRVEGEWLAPPAARRVEVRATLVDAAGNRAEQSGVAGAQASGSLASDASVGGPGIAPPAGFGGARSGPVDPFAVAERRAGPLPPVSSATSDAAAAPKRPATSSLAPAPLPIPGPRRETLPARRPRTYASTPWPVERPKTKAFAQTAPSSRPTSPFGAASFRATPRVPDDAPPMPADAPRRIVNDLEFEFDYELEDTGRWGVGKVELWGTDNRGRTWRRFAIDSDRQSPIHVRTPGEGRYGFRLVVEPVGGLDVPTPKPGDPPEAIVVVDLQRPRVVLKDVRQGEGYFADQLIIEWRAGDEHLVERPIDLFYSNRPTGPWVPVATGLPNSGRHAWRLQRHLPRQPYLKLQARDEAGNVASVTTPEPITIDVPTAGGSLRGVRASGR